MKNEDIEIQLLLEAIYLKYGYDFRDYAQASIKRRILQRLSRSGMKSIAEMQHRLLEDLSFFDSLLLDFSINVTEMFRDPSYYQVLRQQVLPVLTTYPFVRVWVAGCSTGEEAYSLAILFREEGLRERYQIYATDMNEVVLQKARAGIFPIKKMKDYTHNYQKAGGREAFSDYYIARYEGALLEQSLKKKIVFAVHNLTTDNVFNEMHLITCRNVLIYFNRTLQNRAYRLFCDSLCSRGFLGLGTKESLQFSDFQDTFDVVTKAERIYRKKQYADQI